MGNLLGFAFYTLLAAYGSRRRKRKFGEEYGKLLHIGRLRGRYFPIGPILEGIVSLAVLGMVAACFDAEGARLPALGLRVLWFFDAAFRLKDLVSDWRKVYVHAYGVVVGGKARHVDAMKDYREDESGLSVVLPRRGGPIVFEILRDCGTESDAELAGYRNKSIGMRTEFLRWLGT